MTSPPHLNDRYEARLAFRPDQPPMIVDPLSKPGCPFPAVDHTVMVCPHCEPERYQLGPAQRARIEALIREREWRTL